MALTMRAFALRTKSRFINRENRSFPLNANALNGGNGTDRKKSFGIAQREVGKGVGRKRNVPFIQKLGKNKGIGKCGLHVWVDIYLKGLRNGIRNRQISIPGGCVRAGFNCNEFCNDFFLFLPFFHHFVMHISFLILANHFRHGNDIVIS